MRGDNGGFVQASMSSSEPSDGIFPIILCNSHDTDWGGGFVLGQVSLTLEPHFL